MKIDLINDTLAFSGSRSYPVTFWIGETQIGRMSNAKDRFPWREIGLHIRSGVDQSVVAFGEDGTFLGVVDISAVALEYFGQDQLANQMSAAIGPGKWQLYRIGVSGQKLSAYFGIVLPVSLSDPSVTILCENKAPTLIADYRDDRFSDGHWFMPAGHVRGVYCEYQLEDIPPYVRFDAHVKDADGTVAPYRFQLAHTSFPMLDELPEEARIKRVSGALANRVGFVNGGREAFSRILDVAEKYKMAVSRSTKVLDWGVGCGRVARLFAKETDAEIFGIDIDHDNVNWCKENLRGEYIGVDLQPPTPLNENSFDLVYACSVLSHLSEDDAHAWLDEISRILKRDGIALLSFNGTSNGISYLSRRPAKIRELVKSGFFYGDTNHDLKGFIPSDDYYKATFATDEWWRSVFSTHFDVLGIEPAVVSGFQDFAVVRKL